METQKLLIALNGVGAAALLTFLGAIWGKTNAQLVTLGAIISLALFAGGVRAGINGRTFCGHSDTQLFNRGVSLIIICALIDWIRSIPFLWRAIVGGWRAIVGG